MMEVEKEGPSTRRSVEESLGQLLEDDHFCAATWWWRSGVAPPRGCGEECGRRANEIVSVTSTRKT